MEVLESGSQHQHDQMVVGMLQLADNRHQQVDSLQRPALHLDSHLDTSEDSHLEQADNLQVPELADNLQQPVDSPRRLGQADSPQQMEQVDSPQRLEQVDILQEQADSLQVLELMDNLQRPVDNLHQQVDSLQVDLVGSQDIHQVAVVDTGKYKTHKITTIDFSQLPTAFT